MPGSPPSSTSDPGTTPPPSTRSNSSMPVESRTALARLDVGVQRGARATRPAARSGWRAPRPRGSAARSSTSVFQPPHSAQRPIHLGACAPHSWQTKTTLGAFIRIPAPPGAQTADDLPRNRADRRRPSRARRSAATLSSPCRPMITTSSPGLHVAETGHVDRHHVHRDRADDRRAMAAHRAPRPRPARRVSRPSAYPAGTTAIDRGSSVVNCQP